MDSDFLTRVAKHRRVILRRRGARARLGASCFTIVRTMYELESAERPWKGGFASPSCVRTTQIQVTGSQPPFRCCRRRRRRRRRLLASTTHAPNENYRPFPCRRAKNRPETRNVRCFAGCKFRIGRGRGGKLMDYATPRRFTF